MKKYRHKNINKISHTKRVPRKFKKIAKNIYGDSYFLIKEGKLQIQTYFIKFDFNETILSEQIKIKQISK